MKPTFANLPTSIEKAIATILSDQESSDWMPQARALHERYQTRIKNPKGSYIADFSDSLAYLALRAPATYAQLIGAFHSTKELLPSWKPKTILDIGSGPGTALWAAHEMWSSITEAVAIDQHEDLLILGKKMQKETDLPLSIDWKLQNITKGLYDPDKSYDMVIIANVLNELSPAASEKILGQAFNKCNGILIIIEPGTPLGSEIVQNAATKLRNAGTIIAPYVENTVVKTENYYLHFPQRFIRPEFQRRIRQHMREQSLMASDWEETKYAYTVISKLDPEIHPTKRLVGPISKQKGFLELPVLTKDGLVKMKIMKRNKEEYNAAKDLDWGDIIQLPSEPQ